MKKEKDSALVFIDTIYSDKKYPHWERVEVKARFEHMGESFFVHGTRGKYKAIHVTSGRRVGDMLTTSASAKASAIARMDKAGAKRMAEIFRLNKEWYETTGKTLEVVE